MIAKRISQTIALALLTLPAASFAADPPAKPADMGMPGMSMSGPMNMGLAPMPAVYAGQADKPGAPVFDNLGGHHHAISTRNPRTQMFFDQGVKLMFGFNHAEAIRSFREGARLDPHCAMCWWGVAFALGPNINLPMPDDALAPAWQAMLKAKALEAEASPEEREWIEALAARYSADPKADRKAMDEAFAQAMGRLWKAHPDDLDAGTFYAEAMMDTQPWDYWQADGSTPKGHGAEIVSTLETIIKQAPDHPGALHLYIHAVEASTTPERGEAAADRLFSLMPGAGHIVHMPGHIYYRVGRYADAVRVNELAAQVDEAYIASCKAQGYYPAGYYGHNIHFLWTSSEMEGRREASLDAARRLLKAIDPASLAKDMPQADLYEFTPSASLLAFGRWQEILAEPAPPAEMKLATAVWLEARGFAHANTGDLAAAGKDQEALTGLAQSDFGRWAAAGVPAHDMTDLALAALDGEIARRSGDLTGAIRWFRLAADIEAKLPYSEPPYWHQPTSHLLGAVLMEAHRPADAEAVYRESLKSYRGDGWALYGLTQALEAQGKTGEAAETRKAFEQSWKFADVKLTASRF